MIPNLNIQLKPSIIKKYRVDKILKIIETFLFSNDHTYRSIDKDILKLDSEKTKGFESMAIVRHFGLTSEHKGIFEKVDKCNAIEMLKT